MPDKVDFWWSAERARAMELCPRRYWFHYLASGAESRANDRARTIHVLSRLLSRREWMDQTVHNCLRWVLDTLHKSGAAPAEERALQLLNQRLQKDFVASGEGLYWNDPHQHVGLLEHEYDEREVDDEEWGRCFASGLQAVSQFYQGGLLELFRARREDWIELGARGEFTLQVIAMVAPVDAALRDGEGLLVFDWSVGAAEDGNPLRHLAQIIGAARRSEKAPECVSARVCDLATGRDAEVRVNPEQAGAAETGMLQSAGALLARHDEPEKNFAFAEDAEECQRCRYLRVCPRWCGEFAN